jgi:hypothetical protein
MRFIPAVVLMLAFASTRLAGQDTTRHEDLCFRPVDGSRCRNYIIAEVGYSKALNSTTSRLTYSPGITAIKTDFKQTYHGGLGLARNFGNRKSIGAAVIIDHAHEELGFGGLELRYRDWVDTSSVAMEFHLGYARPVYEVVAPCDCVFMFRRFDGMRAGMALQIGRYGTAFTRAEIANSDGKRHVGFFVGGGATSEASFVTLVVVGALAVLVPFIFPPST